VAVIMEESQNIFKKQFTMNGKPRAYPDSILVTGPSYSIDTLRTVKTMPLRLKNLSDTIVRKVKLMPVNRHTYPLKKVKVMIPVDEFTESKFDIPIHFKGVPDSLTIKTFPKTVQVRYIVTLSHFNEVTPDFFYAYIDYSSVDPEFSAKLKVELDSVPPFLHNVSITPRSVEFLIERKNAETWTDRRNR